MAQEPKFISKSKKKAGWRQKKTSFAQSGLDVTRAPTSSQDWLPPVARAGLREPGSHLNFLLSAAADCLREVEELSFARHPECLQDGWVFSQGDRGGSKLSPHPWPGWKQPGPDCAQACSPIVSPTPSSLAHGPSLPGVASVLLCIPPRSILLVSLISSGNREEHI